MTSWDPPGTAATQERPEVPLAGMTTLRVGGPARRVVEATEDDQIVDAVAAADAAGAALLVIGGGSNLLIADAGFPGTVLRIRTRGVSATPEGDHVRLSVAAGEPWDDVVARAVGDELAGIECLAGIPGATGATPIQNVGAYGQQVAETIVSVLAYDRRAREIVELGGEECQFAYRASRFRGHADHVVLGVSFRLRRSPLACPLRYGELAAALGAAPGARPALTETREAVLALRRRKGMVLDAEDPDSVSAGSFFVNPLLSADEFAALCRRAARRVGDDVRPPGWPEPDGRVKTSAAWLIERAGFHRGYGAGRAGISHKHTLALVNRGGATAAELVSLAREVRDGVRAAFGVTLVPEPVLVGLEL